MPEMRCVFCSNEADTKEHIPARHFFKDTPDKDLITVPSCKSCNRGFQADEEFFRQFWVSMLMERSSRAKELLDNEITRSIKRKPALAWKMFGQMQVVDIYTSSGCFAGQATAYSITDTDRARINRVVEKIIRGLFYKQFKQFVPDNWLIKICWITPQLEQEQKLQELAHTLLWNVIKDDTFAYGVGFVPETYQSVWILDFFKIPLFYVYVVDQYTAMNAPQA